MADNTEEEHLDNPVNIQSENNSNEISPTTETETITPSQEPKNMEVHKHPHHVTHKKKLGEYLLEFLMLFLAVFLGFVAENFREHQVEYQRAKIYAENLYQELKIDTTRLGKVSDYSVFLSNKFDTLCLYSTEKKERNITNGMLYYYAQFTLNVDYFSSNTSTMDELKGSGSLHMMTSNVASAISGYDKKMRELANEYQILRLEFKEYEALYFKIFDRYISQTIMPPRITNINRDSVFRLQPALITDDPRLMKEFIGWMKFEQYIFNLDSESFFAPLKQEATELLALLKKEYHLE